jgi:hypothetical protein
MKQILGIVGSARPWGNSELLVRQALRGAQSVGATARLNGQRATCPICGREATVEGDGQCLALRFDAANDSHHRWTPERLRTHMVEWVMASGPRFMARRDVIKARRRPYRQMDAGWLCPPSSDGGRKEERP